MATVNNGLKRRLPVEVVTEKEVLPNFFREQCILREDKQFEQEMDAISEKVLTPGVRKKTIFISYAWPYEHHEEPSVHDKQVKPFKEIWTKLFVIQFRNDLVRLGFEVILDEKNLGLGRHLTSAMDESVKKADHVFLIVSHTYLYKINYRPLSGVAVEFNATERHIDRVHENVGALNRHLSKMTVGEINQTRLVCPLVLVDKFEDYEYFPLVDGFGGYASRYLTKSSYVETLCDIVHKLYELQDRQDFDVDQQFKYFRRRATVPLLFERNFAVYSPESIDSFDIWEKNINFVGRDKELQELRENLEKYSLSLIAPAITGAGGVGKSQLANALVHDAIERCTYPLIVWINVSSQLNSLGNNFRRFAQEKLGIKTGDLSDELIVKRVHEELRTYRKRNAKVLFIFDDIPDEKTLRKYLPEHSRGFEHIHVLVTTRNQNWSQRFQKVSLKAFTPEESAVFIRKMLPEATNEDVAALGDEMLHFPLALAQAVAYIKQGNLKIKTYIENEYHPFQKKSLSYKIDEQFHDAKYERTVFTNWLLAVKELFNVNSRLAPYALAIMFVSAYCESESIPRDLLIQLVPDEEKEIRTEILILLAKYSLLELGKPETYNTHQMLQHVIRLTAETTVSLEEDDDIFAFQKIQAASAIPQKVQGELNKVKDDIFWLMVGLWYLYDYFDTERYAAGTLKDITEDQRRMLQHLYKALSCAQPETLEGAPLAFVAKLYFMISISFMNTGNFNAAEECVIKAINNYFILKKKNEERFNASRVDFIFALIIRGTVKMGLGNFEVALAELQVTLPMIEEAEFEAESEKQIKRLYVALCQMNLGIAYASIGDTYNGDFLFNRSVVVLEQELKDNPYQLASAYAQRATFLAIMGKPQESRDFLERNLDLIERYLGEKHPKVGVVYGQYAAALYGTGDQKKASVYVEKALPILEACYGKNNPQFLITLGQQAAILCEQGENVRARKILEEIIPLFNVVLQDDHPQIAVARGLLAKVYDLQGDLKQSIEFYKKGLLALIKHYGPAHPETNFMRRALGNVYIKAGEEKEGGQFLTEADLYRRESQQSNSKSLLRYGIVDPSPEKEQKIKAFYSSVIPKGFVLGKAIGKGDCFFDASATELNDLNDVEDRCDVKSLRTLVSEYAKSKEENNGWIKNAFRKESNEYDDYVNRVIYDSEEIELPIWGNAALDGRIICQKYNVKLHVIEYRELEGGESLLSHDVVDSNGLRTGEFPAESWNDPRMIHLAVCNLHFVPIRRKEVKEKQKRAAFVMSGVTQHAFEALPKPELLPDEDELTAARRWIEISEKWLLSQHFEKASVYFEKALEILKRCLGEGSPEAQLCKAKLFCAMEVIDSSIKDENRLDEVRRVIEASLGNNPAASVNPFLALLDLLYAQRLQTLADLNCYIYSERAFEALRKILHPNDVRMAVCHVYYGAFLAIKKKNLRLARHHMMAIALPVLENYFGKYSVKICAFLSQIASILSVEGEMGKAEKYLRRSLQIIETNPQEEGWELLRAESCAQLAGVALQRGKYQEAAQLLEEAAPVLLSKLGEDNAQAACLKGMHALVLFSQGLIDEAQLKCSESLSVLEEKYGPDDPQTAIVYGTHALLLNAKKDHKEALKYIEKAVPVLRKHYGDSHLQTAIVSINYVNILMETEDIFSHVKYANDILEKSRVCFKRVGMTLVDYYMAKSKISLFENDLSSAKEYFEKMLLELTRLFQDEPTIIGGLYINYAEMCLKAKQVELAQEYFSAGLASYYLLHEHEPLVMAEIYKKTGEICLKHMAFELAEYYLEEAVKIFDLYVGDFSELIKEVYFDLGKSCLEAGHNTLAGKYFRAFRKVMATVEPDSEELASVDAFLAKNNLFEIDANAQEPVLEPRHASPRAPQPHQDFFQPPVLDPDKLILDAVAFGRSGDQKKQCENINRALTINSQHAAAHYQKARYLFDHGDQQGDLDTALDHLQRNLAYEKDKNKHSHANFLQAKIYHKKNALELALESLRCSLIIIPSDNLRAQIFALAEEIFLQNPFLRLTFHDFDAPASKKPGGSK